MVGVDGERGGCGGTRTSPTLPRLLLSQVMLISVWRLSRARRFSGMISEQVHRRQKHAALAAFVTRKQRTERTMHTAVRSFSGIQPRVRSWNICVFKERPWRFSAMFARVQSPVSNPWSTSFLPLDIKSKDNNSLQRLRGLQLKMACCRPFVPYHHH